MAGWKPAIWITWVIHALISATYLGLCVTTGNNIKGISITGSNSEVYKNGLMACAVLSFIVVFLFLIASPIIMIGRIFGANLTLSYGMLLGAGFNAAWVVLLSGLVLNANKQLASDLNDSSWWSGADYSAFQATYAFAYIMCGSFIILTIILFFGRTALDPEATYRPNAGAAAPVGGSTGQVEMQGSGMQGSSKNAAQWPPAGGAPSGANGGAWNGWNGGTTV